ncbi:tRNA pseudouridine synthase A [Streptomyces badius]
MAHVDLPEAVWAEHEEKLLRRLAGRLPLDVRIWRAAPAPPGFNARFSALWRRYAYRVGDRPGGVDPLTRGHVLWHDRPLDLDAMNEAAALMVGEHDFAAYCKKREGATTIRTLQKLSWVRDPESGVLTATVQADAFCHNMVRALIGAALFVGDGRRPALARRGAGGEGARPRGARGAPARADAGGSGVPGGRLAGGEGRRGAKRTEVAGCGLLLILNPRAYARGFGRLRSAVGVGDGL